MQGSTSRTWMLIWMCEEVHVYKVPCNPHTYRSQPSASRIHILHYKMPVPYLSTQLIKFPCCPPTLLVFFFYPFLLFDPSWRYPEESTGSLSLPLDFSSPVTYSQEPAGRVVLNRAAFSGRRALPPGRRKGNERPATPKPCPWWISSFPPGKRDTHTRARNISFRPQTTHTVTIPSSMTSTPHRRRRRLHLKRRLSPRGVR